MNQRKKQKKNTLRHLAKPVSLPIGLQTMTTLGQITAIIKIQEEPPERCQRQKQILLSKSKFFSHCPIQILSQWRKYIVPRTFPVQTQANMTLLIKVFILNVYGLVEQFPIMHFRLSQKHMLLIKYNKYSTLFKKKLWCK